MRNLNVVLGPAGASSAAQVDLRKLAADAAIQSEVWIKCSRRILPILFGIFFFSHLNRVNLSYAASSMTRDLGFSPTVYGIGAGLFFLSYALFQIPANLVAARIGFVRALVTLMTCWGFASCLNGAMSTPAQFYGLRVLLGAFESGSSPILMLMLTQWFVPKYRGVAFSLFAVSMPIAGAFGGPVSSAIISSFAGVGDLAGWRWLFFLEGMPTLVLAIIAAKYLPGSPQDASWLSVDAKASLAEAQTQSDKSIADERVRSEPVLKTGEKARVPSDFAIRATILAGAWGFFTGTFVGTFYWMPKFLSDEFNAGIGPVGWYVGAGYAVLAGTLLYGGRLATNQTERARVALLASLSFTLAFLLIAASKAGSLQILIAEFIVMMGIMGLGMSAFWSIGLQAFSSRQAPLGIGIINCASSVASFALVSLFGTVADAAGSLRVGLVVLALSVVIAGVFALIWFVRIQPRHSLS